MSEPSDTGDIPPDLTEWQLDAIRHPERRTVAWVAPWAAGKSAALSSLLRFRAETVGEWIEAGDTGDTGDTVRC